MRDCVTNENMSLHQIFENEVNLEVFNRHKWEIFLIKIINSYIWFPLCSGQTFRRMIQETYFMFGLQLNIWLNIPKDHCQIFYIFLWMVTTSAPKRKFLQKKTLVCRLAPKNLLLWLVLLCYYFSAKLSQIEIPFTPSVCFCDDQFALSGPHFWTYRFLVHCWLLSLLFTILTSQALSPHWSAEPFTHISLKFVIQMFYIADNQPDKFELLIAINVKLGYSKWSRSFRRIYINCGACQLSSYEDTPSTQFLTGHLIYVQIIVMSPFVPNSRNTNSVYWYSKLFSIRDVKSSKLLWKFYHGFPFFQAQHSNENLSWISSFPISLVVC
jgi:hypothetical protein